MSSSTTNCYSHPATIEALDCPARRQISPSYASDIQQSPRRIIGGWLILILGGGLYRR